jgi:hypothetical protein
MAVESLTDPYGHTQDRLWVCPMPGAASFGLKPTGFDFSTPFRRRSAFVPFLRTNLIFLPNSS